MGVEWAFGLFALRIFLHVNCSGPEGVMVC
jgi:hypothetical protein